LDTSSARAQLNALASHFLNRTDAILKSCREAIAADPALSTGSSLTRSEFNDHIPRLLFALAATLRRAVPPEGWAKAVIEIHADEDHGRLRWQQGYLAGELVREWGHLQLVLVDELEQFALSHPETDSSVLRSARLALVAFMREAVSDSMSQYYDLRHAEAEGRVRDLEEALSKLNELERSRGELLHEVSHDLRGSLTAVSNAAAVLTVEHVPETAHSEALEVLRRNLSSLQTMFTGLMDLARLEAGREQRELAIFNAGHVLVDLCKASQLVARERGLELNFSGPESFPVEGDVLKVIRIVQNLLLNALRLTPQGSVNISWGEQDDAHWAIVVSDTGPGVAGTSAEPLTQALKDATDTAREAEPIEDSQPASAPTQASAPLDVVRDEPAKKAQEIEAHGEGIGLSIVKRLCEMLDAKLEVESQQGQGSAFRVVLPRRYE
jgi:signal transduction histidine kinase